MIETIYYIAAFAAFCLFKPVRFASMLCVLVAAINLNSESLPDNDYYAWYYVISCVANLVACRIVLTQEITWHTKSMAFLFALAAFVDFIGGLMFWYYVDFNDYKIIGFYVIVTQLVCLGRSGGGGIARIIRGSFIYIRNRIFV